MASVVASKGETYKKIKTILVSQPKPERSPYYDLEKKYGLQIDWRPFIHVEGLEARDFRKQKVKPEEFGCIILNSKNSVDHFFRLCEDMRIKMSPETRYFCLTESVANYLQKFIVYRKRKVFVGERSVQDLKSSLLKYKDKERFLLVCSNLGAKDISVYLDELQMNWQEAVMYNTVSSDLSDLKDIFYDVLVFFSPLGIKSLVENFPTFEQKETRIAVFGTSTKETCEEHNLKVNILAPAPETPSMTMALEKYLQISNAEG